MIRNDVIGNLKKEVRTQAALLERKRRVTVMWLLAGIGAASFFMTFLLLFINPAGIDLRYTVTFGALVPSAIIYLLLSRAYMNKARLQFVKGLCAATGFSHRPEGCFDIAAAGRHKILPEHDKGKILNGLQGTYNGVPVAVQEVLLTALKQDPAHKNRKKEYLRFWGLLVRITLSRSVEGHTVAMPRTTMQTFFNTDFSKYQKVKLPEGRFGHMFEINATDGVEAKFILSAAFRDRFLDAGRHLNAYWSEASFKGTEVLLAFQRFRPLIHIDPLWKPVTVAALQKNADELESIAGLIDTLKANHQISL